MENIPRISQFREKARWALHWHGIYYDKICWPPGVRLHISQGSHETSEPGVMAKHDGS